MTATCQERTPRLNRPALAGARDLIMGIPLVPMKPRAASPAAVWLRGPRGRRCACKRGVLLAIPGSTAWHGKH